MTASGFLQVKPAKNLELLHVLGNFGETDYHDSSASDLLGIYYGTIKSRGSQKIGNPAS
jgi:hypothetical protein